MKSAKKHWARVFPPLIPFAVAVAGLEAVVRLGWVPDYIVPAPSDVVRSLSEDRSELLWAMIHTLFCAFLGLLMSFVSGLGAALFLSWSDFARRAFYPYAVFFQTVPVIAIAPLLVIWFGFGQPTVIASSFICSVFPVIATTLVGLRSTDPALIDLFRLYSASRWRVLWSCRLPFALPHLFSGLRIAAGLAVIGAIVGEFIGGGGLGSVVDGARSQQRIDKVFAAVLASSILGLVLVGGVNALARIALGRWHTSEQSEQERKS